MSESHCRVFIELLSEKKMILMILEMNETSPSITINTLRLFLLVGAPSGSEDKSHLQRPPLLFWK